VLPDERVERVAGAELEQDLRGLVEHGRQAIGEPHRRPQVKLRRSQRSERKPFRLTQGIEISMVERDAGT
jgi:hypothetical protein